MTLAGLFGVTFLTPLAALFALAAAVPLGALALAERRARDVRRLLRVHGPQPRALVPVLLALVLLPTLVAVAAAQPVVVRQQTVGQRADVEAFVVFDTSRSMLASLGQHRPDRLARAKQMALRLERALPDIPFGVVSMTDRSLPHLMPTVDRTVFERTVKQSVGIDRPPPSQPYKGRATTFDAIVPLVDSRFFGRGVQHRLLVVFTDGESAQVSPLLRYTLEGRMQPIFVHVWEPGERIFRGHGRVDRGYTADPSSTAALNEVAAIAGGSTYPEQDFSSVAHAARNVAGQARDETRVSAYARVALARWFILAALAPLAFLLWRRNA